MTSVPQRGLLARLFPVRSVLRGLLAGALGTLAFGAPQTPARSALRRRPA